MNINQKNIFGPNNVEKNNGKKSEYKKPFFSMDNPLIYILIAVGIVLLSFYLKNGY